MGLVGIKSVCIGKLQEKNLSGAHAAVQRAGEDNGQCSGHSAHVTSVLRFVDQADFACRHDA